MIILAAYFVIFVLMVLLAIWASEALSRPPQGCHAREDAPTLGDVLAGWISAHVRGCLHLADDITRWHPWRSLQVRLQSRQLRRDIRLRVPAAASAPGEGTASGTSAQEAVPPHPVYGPLTDTPAEGITVSLAASPGYAVRIGGHPPWLTADMPRLPEVMQ